MRAVDLLQQVRKRWAERVVHRLARGERTRESFRQELARYIDLVEQAILSGDPAWLNEILEQWISARTQSEQQEHKASLAPILRHILLSLSSVARENLSDSDALELLTVYLPLHSHALEYASRREGEAYFQYVANELEEARRRLERIDRSKSNFISVAAHELRTPLTLIEGYTSMLLESFAEEEASALLLKGISTGVQRLREIINDMIDVSLIDNQLLELNFQPVWLHQLLRIAIQELQDVLQKRNLTLRVENFPGSDEMLFADSERLYQAFFNLLTNAVKYTPNGGKITVSGRKLPGFIEVTVSDTGIGIDPEDQTLIFEKFGNLGDASLHSSSKTQFKGGGPGLGLPISKGIIEAHGGTIWVESPGYDEKACPGSTFHVLLPIHKEAPSQHLNKLFRPLLTQQSRPNSHTDEQTET